MKIDITNINKKYDIIYVDPPWAYRWGKGKSSGNFCPEKHYKTMSTEEICELDAIMQYQSHYDATDDQSARGTILDIMNEEKLHVGQLFGLLFSLDPESKRQFEKGLKEFEEKFFGRK